VVRFGQGIFGAVVGPLNAFGCAGGVGGTDGVESNLVAANRLDDQFFRVVGQIVGGRDDDMIVLLPVDRNRAVD
jgi:hypothetical protein